MSYKEIPDAVVTESSHGLITYQQNLFPWAKNSGQAVYQEIITVGAPLEENKRRRWLRMPWDALRPVVTVSTPNGHHTSKDPVLTAKMKNMLQQVNEDGIVDHTERAAVTAIMNDVLDDGELNASVPHPNEKTMLVNIIEDYADDRCLNGSVPNVLVRPARAE